MAKKKINWGLVGAIVGVCAAPFTGGASLVMAGKVLVPTLIAAGGLGYAGGKIAEATGILDSSGGDDDSLNKNLDAWKIQNEQWKVLVDANREETKRLREERETNDKKIKLNNDETDRLRAIINNPQSTDEEKNNAKKRIVLLETEVKNLKEKNKKIDKDVEEKSKIPSAPSQPWSLPNLKFIDKVILGGGITLITYLLISKDEKKK